MVVMTKSFEVFFYNGTFATIDNNHLFASDGYSNLLVIDAKKKRD